MPRYRVTWEIDIDARNCLLAATRALEIQRSADSVATVFEVVEDNGKNECVVVDLHAEGERQENPELTPRTLLVSTYLCRECRYKTHQQFRGNDDRPLCRACNSTQTMLLNTVMARVFDPEPSDGPLRDTSRGFEV